MRRFIVLLLLIIGSLFLTQTAQAQSCGNATIVIDATIVVDEAAICDAAEPLADAGYRVLLYLTEYAPPSEDAWFAALDQVEIDTGLRDASNGGFQRTGYALEASIAENAPGFATSITVGERLYDSAIDPEAGRGADQIRVQLANGISSGDYTGGLVGALEVSAELLNLTPSTSGSDSSVDSAVPDNSTETQTSGGNGVLGAVLAVGALGAAGAIAYPTVIKPARDKRKREEEELVYLAGLQQRVANLLLACERLLGGTKVEESVLYQLFETYGGIHYPEINEKVTGMITNSQSALDNIFSLRSKLQDEEIIAQRGTTQLIEDWERMYVTLVGSSERILELSDSELHVLLDPLEVLERKPADSQLAGQLSDIAKEIEGVPLTVELREVDPATMDEEGILGYVDAVQAEIGRLQAATHDAPDMLEAARRVRHEREQEATDESPFLIAETERYAGIDARLETAAMMIDRGLALRAIEEINEIEQLQIRLNDLRTVEAAWPVRLQTVQQVAAAGYRPPLVAQDEAELEQDLAEIGRLLREGNPVEVEHWITELDNDSRRAQEHAVAWQQLHRSNTERTANLQTQLGELRTLRAGDAAYAWQQLQTYPAGNWDDLQQSLNEAGRFLESEGGFAAIESANGMERQLFEEADQRLTVLEGRVAAAETGLQSVVDRLDEVVSAEANIEAAIAQARSDLKAATVFRDTEDRKIDTTVDQQLSDAQGRLDAAARARDSRNFRAAMVAQTTAHKLITEAYQAANEQVKRINELHDRVNQWLDERKNDLERKVRYTSGVEEVMLPPATQKAVRDALHQVSLAHQLLNEAEGREDAALAESLTATLAAFESAETQITEAEKSVRLAEKQYDTLFQDTRRAIQKANTAISEAEREGSWGRTGGDWRRLVSKAQRLVPAEPTKAVSTDKLRRMLQDANEARDLAKRARRAAQDARHRSQQRDMERTMRRSVIISPTPSPGWNRPSSAPRRSISPRSTGPISAPRPSPTPGRRSSGGMGGSRRSSGGMGGSRRG